MAFSTTTWHQKGKPFWILTTISFYRPDALPATQPMNSVKALKAHTFL